MQDNTSNRFYKGLNIDISPLDYNEGQYKYALNAVTKTSEGYNSFLSNEGSNKLVFKLTPGFTPIGKEYIGNNKTVIFSVNAETQESEIGIFNSDGEGNYEVFVNDRETPIGKNRLNFNLTHQIEATFRLRRGCERVVYFTDNLNKPRYFNFDKVDNFKDSFGHFISSKFNLQKVIDLIPQYNTIEVLNSQGNLKPGSYNFAIQYLDESLNPTEILSNSNVIKIYNDSLNEEFLKINGSISSEADYIKFRPTNKAIRITLKSLDITYPFYRIVIIESNNGSGLINNVFYSEQIPTSNNTFVYTGNNYVSKGTIEEVLATTDFIEKAVNIEQIENRLLLANTQGKDINYCNLQKYASKIQADCIVKTVNINSMEDRGSSKNPLQDIEGLGYMPGEIYSFGIQYIFEDNTLSPVFHIPGRGKNVGSDIKYTSGDNVFPMSSQDNEITNTYENKNFCGQQTYWGLDCSGEYLQGKKVRHHRFPFRSDLGIPLIKEKSFQNYTQTLHQLTFKIIGKLKIKENNEFCKPFEITVNYKNNNQNYTISKTVDPAFYSSGEKEVVNVEIVMNSQYHFTDFENDLNINFSDISFQYPYEAQKIVINSADDNTGNTINNVNGSFDSNKINVIVHNKLLEQSKGFKQYETKILGIRFSNIEVPSESDTNDNKIIGYYIVRNERKEEDKTVLDSGVLTQSVIYSKYVSHGLLAPETDPTRISGHLFGIINPEFKFNNKQNNIYDKIIQEGYFDIKERKYGKVNYDDVYDGSSYDEKHHSKKNDDAESQDHSPTSRGFDGWSLSLITRDNIVEYKTLDKPKYLANSQADIEKIFYLDALGNSPVHGDSFEYYNTSADNKISVIQFAENSPPQIPHQMKLPYVIFYRSNSSVYSNFRLLPYYKEHQNPKYFRGNSNSSIDIFNGDSYISSMRYCNSTYYDNRVSLRDGKKSIWKIVVGAFIALIGAVALIFSAGTSTILIGAGIALIGAATLLASSGIKQENFNKTYVEEYEKGLRNTVIDDWTNRFYNFKSDIPFGFYGNGEYGQDGHSDDTIMWIGEAITDLWFESNINLNLRNKFINDVTPTFLDSPGLIEQGNNTPIGTVRLGDRKYTDSNAVRHPVSMLEKHFCRKLLAYDPKRDDLKYYIGIALGEYYNINPDYHRKNKEKMYFHLPYEYDCCSDCREKFPHRIHYSEQSFQEELSDNYRVFLPNNYRDIEGETGCITNLFKLNNNLYIHTEEALWQQPRNYQERVTDQITSFIGTGSYFEIPPQKILDSDSGFSAGCQHKWGSLKTPNGYFFMSANQNKYYQFTGQLKPISSIGMKTWFDNNTKSIAEEVYFKQNRKPYPFKNNPSNNLGTGFISTYDSLNERIILTKRDYKPYLFDSDYQFCTKNGKSVVFKNISQVIADFENRGYQYVGVDNCRLKFKKDVVVTKKITYWEYVKKTESTVIVKDTDVFIYLDMSGSFNNITRNHIVTTCMKWFSNFLQTEKGKTWTGNLHFLVTQKDNDSERNFYSVQFFEPVSGKYIQQTNQALLFKISNSYLRNNNTFINNNDFILNLVAQPSLLGICPKNSNSISTYVSDGTITNPNQLIITFSNENAKDVVKDISVYYYYPKETELESAIKSLNIDENSESSTIYFLEYDIRAYKNYVDKKRENKRSFHFISYPIVYYNYNANNEDEKKYQETNSAIFLQHQIACLEKDYLSDETLCKYFNIKTVNDIGNTAFSFPRRLWGFFRNSLLKSYNPGRVYPYSDIGGLKDYNFSVVANAAADMSNVNNNPLKLSDFDKNFKSLLEAEEQSNTYYVWEQKEKEISTIETEYSFYEGEEVTDVDKINNGWTLSYSLENEAWVSFHSYIPNMYIEVPGKFYSYLNKNKTVFQNSFWQHNSVGQYQIFYNTFCPHIIEYVSVSNPLATKIWNFLTLNTEAKEYNTDTKTFFDVDQTFNKAIFYNSRQCSGLISLINKHSYNSEKEFLEKQVSNENFSKSIIEKREKDWFINDFRDMRIIYSVPIWNTNIDNISLFYNDKQLITEYNGNKTIDIEKDWTQQENFRDKFLVIRLIFDNFTNLNLTTNYVSENFQISQH